MKPFTYEIPPGCQDESVLLLSYRVSSGSKTSAPDCGVL